MPRVSRSGQTATGPFAQQAVEVVGVEPGERTGAGHAQEQPAAGTQHPRRLGDGGLVVDDEGKLVEQEDGVEGSIGEGPHGDRGRERTTPQRGGGTDVEFVGGNLEAPRGEACEQARIGADGEDAGGFRGGSIRLVVQQARHLIPSPCRRAGATSFAPTGCSMDWPPVARAGEPTPRDCRNRHDSCCRSHGRDKSRDYRSCGRCRVPAGRYRAVRGREPSRMPEPSLNPRTSTPRSASPPPSTTAPPAPAVR